MKPLIVGENNPYGSDPKFALYPLPANSAGGRLCRLVLGMRMVEYLRTFDRVNLLQAPKWSTPEARHHADSLILDNPSDQKFILCGRKVFDAFARHVPDGRDWVPLAARGRFLLLPHPSGLNRWWAEPGSFARAREAIQKFVGEPCEGNCSDCHVRGSCDARAAL